MRAAIDHLLHAVDTAPTFLDLSPAKAQELERAGRSATLRAAAGPVDWEVLTEARRKHDTRTAAFSDAARAAWRYWGTLDDRMALAVGARVFTKCHDTNLIPGLGLFNTRFHDAWHDANGPIVFDDLLDATADALGPLCSLPPLNDSWRRWKGSCEHAWAQARLDTGTRLSGPLTEQLRVPDSPTRTRASTAGCRLRTEHNPGALVRLDVYYFQPPGGGRRYALGTSAQKLTVEEANSATGGVWAGIDIRVAHMVIANILTGGRFPVLAAFALDPDWHPLQLTEALGLPWQPDTRKEAKNAVLAMLNGGWRRLQLVRAPPAWLRIFERTLPEIWRSIIEKNADIAEAARRTCPSWKDVHRRAVALALQDTEDKILSCIDAWATEEGYESQAYLFDEFHVKSQRIVRDDALAETLSRRLSIEFGAPLSVRVKLRAHNQSAPRLEPSPSPRG